MFHVLHDFISSVEIPINGLSTGFVISCSAFHIVHYFKICATGGHDGKDCYKPCARKV